MLPLVLIPGMMCDARLFAPQIAHFARRPVMIANITEHNTIEALANNIISIAPPRFALAGLSMGGIVAMEIIRQAPDRVDRLCLMDTNPFAEAEEVKARRKPQIEAVQEGELSQVMTEQMIPNYLHNDVPNPEIEALCVDMAMNLGEAVFINQSLALRDRPDQTETLKSYLGRSLILHGEDDRLCPASRHEAMHALLQNSNYSIIKKAGHLPSLEAPSEVNTALEAWLEE